MNGECLHSGVLQPFRHFLNIDRLLIPAQSCFYGNGEAGGFHASFGELNHEFKIFQHARTCAFTHDTLDRTAEIDVHKIRLHAINNSRGHRHRLFITAIELNAGGSFLRQDLHFLSAFIGAIDESVAGNKFRVQEISAMCLAKHTEGRITYILHGRK